MVDAGREREAGDPELDLADHVQLLTRVKRAVVARKAALAAAESRLAAATLAQILVAVLLGLLALAATWTLVCVALAFHFVSLGWSVPTICLALAGLNLLLVFLLAVGVRKISRHLTFEATRRNLLE